MKIGCETCGGIHGHAPTCPENIGDRLGKCEICGEDIYDGDGPIEYQGKFYCASCVLDGMTKKEIWRFIGAKVM